MPKDLYWSLGDRPPHTPFLRGNIMPEYNFNIIEATITVVSVVA